MKNSQEPSVAEYLHIQARLPKAAGFELGARLLAARPEWDVEVGEGWLECFIPLIHGQVDAELTVVEESCRAVEQRARFESMVDLTVSRTFDLPRIDPPPALGPWRLRRRPEDAHQAAEPEPDELILPGPWPTARRWWISEELLLTLISDHLTPPPGAPETRGRPTLFLTSVPSAVPPAAVRGGTGPLTLIGAEALQRATQELLAANGHHAEPEAVDQPFTVLARKRDDWLGRFGLIIVHLSPYLAARRVRTLAVWLAPEGALLVSGFAPGAQTAHLLRAAARAGLELATSLVVGEWGAMRLVRIPEREVLPPLTGSVVPDLMEPPEEPFRLEPETPDEDLDQDSLMVAEEEEDY